MNNYYKHIILLFKRIALLILLFTITRIIFYLINYSTFSSIAIKDLASIFFWGIKFDVSAIVFINLLIILLHLIPGEFKNKNFYQLFLKIFFVVLNALILGTNLIDCEFFKFTKKRSTATLFDLLGFGDSSVQNDAVGQIPRYIIEFWYISLIWIGIILVLWFLSSRIPKEVNKLLVPKKKLTYLFQTGIFLVLITLFIYAGRGGFQLKPLRIINAAAYTSSENIPLLLNTPFTIMKTIGKSALKEKNYFSDSEVEKLYSPIQQIKYDSAFQPKNVVVIILESFSKEYIGALNAGKGYTPFLDSLISQSLCFSNAFANGTQSIECMPSILAGIPSLMDNPLIASPYSSDKLNSIASLLKTKGYQTLMLHGGTNGSMGFDNFAQLASFDNYWGRSEYNNEKDFDGKWGIYDEEFLQYTAKILNSTKQPFAACVMTLSSHHPYTVPVKYEKVFTKGTQPIHKVISYADFALQQFFASASKMSWYNNTLFVLCADHTGPAQELFYKNEIGRFAIPIIYFSPSDSTCKGLNDTLVTQQSDIMPSVLDYLKFENKFIAFGKSVFHKSKNNFAINYIGGIYQFIQNEYVLFFDGEKSVAFYHISTDKFLKSNLLEKEKQLANSFEIQLKAIIQQYNNRLMQNRISEN